MWIKKGKDKILKTCRAVIFIIIMCFIVGYLSSVLVSKSSYSKVSPFLKEEENFDVLFMGISHMQVGVYPLDLWKDYGITSFNFGESGARLPYSYWALKNALEYTTPKLVVIDVRRMDVNDKEYDDYVSTVFDEFPLSKTKYEAAMDLFEDWDMRLEFLFPFIKYHSRWTELYEDDFTKESYRINKGAYSYPKESLHVAIPEEHQILSKDDKSEGGALAQKYLRQMIELCQDQGIDVMLTELPYPADEESQRLANGVADIADEYGINYINFLQMDGIIDFDTDMNDKSAHVNDSGARKITAYLGNYIKENYSVPDRREDKKYTSWNDVYKEYEEYKISRIKEQTSLDNYLMLLADENLSSCIYINEGTDILRDERMKKLLRNISQHQDLAQLESAGESGKNYFLIVDNGSSKVWEGVGEEISPDLDTSFGKIKNVAAVDEEPYILIQGTDESYYLNIEENSLTPDIQIMVINNSSGELVDMAAFNEDVRSDNISATRNQF